MAMSKRQIWKYITIKARNVKNVNPLGYIDTSQIFNQENYQVGASSELG